MNRIKDREAQRCILCGEEGRPIYTAVKDFNYGLEGSFNYRHCEACDFLWVDPIPTKEEMARFYKNYFTHDSQRGLKKPSKNGIIRKIKDLIRNSVLCGHYGYRNVHNTHIFCRFGHIMRFMPFIGPASTYRLGPLLPRFDEIKDLDLIDIGCGNGEYIELLRSIGGKVIGIETDPAACSVLRDRHIPFIEGSIEDARLAENSANVITMRHAIEHIRDPLHTINECFRVLRPGGKLILRTPNYAGLAHRTFKSSCYSLDTPRHLHLFSPRSMRLFGKKSLFGSCRIRTLPDMAENTFDISSTIAKRGESFSVRVEPGRGRLWFGLKERILCALGIPVGEEIEAVFTKS